MRMGKEGQADGGMSGASEIYDKLSRSSYVDGETSGDNGKGKKIIEERNKKMFEKQKMATENTPCPVWKMT